MSENFFKLYMLSKFLCLPLVLTYTYAFKAFLYNLVAIKYEKKPTYFARRRTIAVIGEKFIRPFSSLIRKITS